METSDSDAVQQTPRALDTVLAEASDAVSVPPRTPGGDACASASLQLSLNQIKAGELLQRIHADTYQLLGNIESLLQSDFLLGGSRRSRIPGVVVSQPGLLVAQGLSQNVAANVDELVALCHQSAAGAEQQLEKIAPPPRRHKIRRKHRTDSAASYCYPHKTPKRRRPSGLVCQSCHTTSTPQWRNGPAGLWTLCNVCGLMYARRVRMSGRAKRKSASPEASRDCECQTVTNAT